MREEPQDVAGEPAILKPLSEVRKYFEVHGELARLLPSFEHRPQQQQMAEAVEESIRSGSSLVIEAGTGTGKTFAYLIPALLSGKRTIVSTGSRNLQEQIKSKDIPILEELLFHPFSVTVMKGRGNYICLRRFVDYRDKTHANLFQADADEPVEQFFRWGEETDTGDFSDFKAPVSAEIREETASSSELCLGRKCSFYNDCFVMKVRAKAQKSDLILVNHHLFFSDVKMRGSSDTSLLPKAETVIFDEAHMLEGIATEYFGSHVTSRSFTELTGELKRELALDVSLEMALREGMSRLVQLSFDFFQALSDPGKEERRSLPDGDISPEVVAIAEEIERITEALCTEVYTTTNSDSLHRVAEGISETARVIKEILSSSEAEEKTASVRWIESRGGVVSLHLSPLDIAQSMQQDVFPLAESCIFTSATLSSGKEDFRFFKTSLGIADDCKAVQLETPFDYKKNARYYFPKDLPEPSSAEFPVSVAHVVKELVHLSQGRTLVLFTSYRVLNAVYRLLSPELSYPLYRQQEGEEGHRVIQRFIADRHSVLFGTASFWQGIDVVGDSLSCLIIDKFPFAPPNDPVLSARIDYFRKSGKNPFMDYQVPMAVIALRQGFGRLIRSSTDRGIFALLDGRLHSKFYGRKFLNALPEAERVESIAELAGFF